MRPIFKNLNDGAHWFVCDENESFSVDEIMIAYYGRHSTKQFIRAKPIRFGFKIWSLCTADGAGVYFEPYCGGDTDVDDEGLGQGPNVVLSLVQKSLLAAGSKVFFDNLFTSFPLLQRLSALGIAGTGTVRQNRLNRVPITSKKDLQKKAVPRGEMDVVYQSDQVLVAWKDNCPVYIASNQYDAELGEPVRRFSRTDKKWINVPCPSVVSKYNCLLSVCLSFDCLLIL